MLPALGAGGGLAEVIFRGFSDWLRLCRDGRLVFATGGGVELVGGATVESDRPGGVA